MKKYPIGFCANAAEPEEEVKTISQQVAIRPKKSVVEVYFPHRDRSWTYYNDSFDLKVGDALFVEIKK